MRRLRTGISWADWHRPGALAWFDRQMAALEEFDVTVTLCFTPPSRGRRECHTSPPQDVAEFAHFAELVVRRFVLHEGRDPPVPVRLPAAPARSAALRA